MGYYCCPYSMDKSIFRKKTSTPSILTAARPTVRSSDAYNHQTQLNQPVHREVKNIYIRTYRLRMLGLTSSKRNSNSKETHTADEATLDGKLQSQDLVNVSSTNLKTESFPTYFVITNWSYLINIRPTSFRNEVYSRLMPSDAPRFCRKISRERDKDVRRERVRRLYKTEEEPIWRSIITLGVTVKQTRG